MNFLRASNTAIGITDPLTAMAPASPAELLRELELTESWSTVLAELDVLRSGIAGAIATRRNRLGVTARQVYHVSSSSRGRISMPVCVL
jgi:hypothetical protein